MGTHSIGDRILVFPKEFCKQIRSRVHDGRDGTSTTSVDVPLLLSNAFRPLKRFKKEAVKGA